MSSEVVPSWRGAKLRWVGSVILNWVGPTMSSWVNPDPCWSELTGYHVEPSQHKRMLRRVCPCPCQVVWAQAHVKLCRPRPMLIRDDQCQVKSARAHVELSRLKSRLSRHKDHVEPSRPRLRASRVGPDPCRIELARFHVELSHPKSGDKFNVINKINLI